MLIIYHFLSYPLQLFCALSCSEWLVYLAESALIFFGIILRKVLLPTGRFAYQAFLGSTGARSNVSILPTVNV